MSDVTIISRLNHKQVGCNAKSVLAFPEGDKREVRLMRVIGQITGLQLGETDLGEYYALTGRFQATNLQDGTDDYGKTFESGIVFLPPGVHDNYVARVRKLGVIQVPKDGRSKKEELPLKDGQVETFAIDIFVRRDSNASGITYIGREILAPTVTDPLAEIRLAIASIEQQTQLNAAGGAKWNGQAPRQLEAAADPKHAEAAKSGKK